MLAAVSGKDVAVWTCVAPDADETPPDRTFAALATVRALAFSVPPKGADGAAARTLLAAGDSSGSILVWDVGAGTPVLRERRAHRAGAAVTCLAFNPAQGGMLVSGGRDGSVIVCQVDAEPAGVVTVIPVGDPVTALGFSDNGLRLAVGTARGNVYVHAVSRLGQALFEMQLPGSGLAAAVSGCAYAPVPPLRDVQPRPVSTRVAAAAAEEDAPKDGVEEALAEVLPEVSRPAPRRRPSPRVVVQDPDGRRAGGSEDEAEDEVIPLVELDPSGDRPVATSTPVTKLKARQRARSASVSSSSADERKARLAAIRKRFKKPGAATSASESDSAPAKPTIQDNSSVADIVNRYRRDSVAAADKRLAEYQRIVADAKLQRGGESEEDEDDRREEEERKKQAADEAAARLAAAEARKAAAAEDSSSAAHASVVTPAPVSVSGSESGSTVHQSESFKRLQAEAKKAAQESAAHEAAALGITAGDLSQDLTRLIDSRMGIMRAELHDEISGLHIELIRQLHLQLVSISEMMGGKRRESELEEENALLRAEVERLKKQH